MVWDMLGDAGRGWCKIVETKNIVDKYEGVSDTESGMSLAAIMTNVRTKREITQLNQLRSISYLKAEREECENEFLQFRAESGSVLRHAISVTYVIRYIPT